ncbi:sigma-70 family RNA polymerase sigma factor [Agriterribacter sp.]|uniref:RNA polymerase sigma factor n=1 Tax=Agriterribacter sp. TaxID=2821509 RepID=UPI002B5129B8|nr:sigma-70 family RNA polymerase sigma factor [Agriterribacter sp.]HRO45048.1 sigma-70 family RNA polymerase sigma factor [Agriterribacter sp.]HRQ15511.1 sigma-70 family RNA polymerase sigma factor [Agriterribacter sp.]
MEQLLVNDIKQGSYDAFKFAFSFYQSRLHNFIYTKTGSAYYANEVTQLTFIKLWEYRESLSEEWQLSTQIFRIAKTTLIDVLRKTESERLKLEGFGKSGLEEVTGNLPMETYDVNIILQIITEKMPPMRKKVFSLRIEQRLSYKEISSLLSISLKTVNKHMELALPKARARFKSLR